MLVENEWHYVLYVIHSDKYVGCTSNFEKRSMQHKKRLGDNILIEIIDMWPVHLGSKFAGDREWEWADAFNYKRGKHYSRTWNNNLSSEMRILAQKSSITSQLEKGTHNTQTGKSGFHTGAGGRAGGRASILSQLERGVHSSQSKTKNLFFNGVATKASIDSPNRVSRRFFTCPRCGLIGKGPSMLRHINTGTLKCPLIKE